MNIAKNMEAIFLAAVVLASVTTLATAAVPARHSAPASAIASTIASAAPQAGAMQVVTISAKRLSAAEKAALGN